MQLDSILSTTAHPFQPQAAPLSSQEDDAPRAYPAQHGLAGSSPTPGLAADSPAGRAFPSHCQSSDGIHSSGGRHKKKDGFSSKIQIHKFWGKKGHAHDVVDAFRQWAHCITYYRDYYKDSYLIPLVVSYLTGDASDVFDWILSPNPGNTLLQMLRELYCGSLTFREQRNTIENLCQKP